MQTPTKKATPKATHLSVYLLLGIFFGVVLTQSEVLSWYRIQEMFRFQSFHMYGIIGSAVAVAALSVAIIRRWDVTDFSSESIDIPDKKTGRWNTRYWLGGFLFGIGWALTGACPGPIYALIGNGVTVMIVALGAAIAGTLTYGVLRPHLPHY